MRVRQGWREMIPPVLMAVAWIAASLAVFALTAGWLTKRSRVFCWKLFAMALGPALLGAAYSLYYLHFLPEPAWFYQWRSLPGSETLVLAPSVAGAGTFCGPATMVPVVDHPSGSLPGIPAICQAGVGSFGYGIVEKPMEGRCRPAIHPVHLRPSQCGHDTHRPGYSGAGI